MKDMDERNEFLNALFTAHHDSVERSCLRMIRYNPALRDLADDCLQETFYTAAIAYEELKSHPNIGGWLHVTANNKMKNELKKRKVRSKMEGAFLNEDLQASINGIEQWQEKVQNDEIIAKIVSALTDAERPIFQDFFHENLSIKELSQKYGASEGAIKVRLHRIRKKAADIAKDFFNIFSLLCVTFCLFMQYIR